MEKLNALLEIIDRLLGPNGCVWDREQTLSSMRPSLIEEPCELIDAINLNADEKIEEELGDLLFLALFLGRLAENEGKCSLEEACANINTKLIRRHPHIFGDSSIKTVNEANEQWDKIKREEQRGKSKSVLDRIPSGLPALAKAQELIKAQGKSSYTGCSQEGPLDIDEEELGEKLFALAVQAQAAKIDAEQALRKTVAEKEKEFRKRETAK